MKRIQNNAGVVMIAVVVICALSFFWFVNSSKESFASGDKKTFTMKNSNNIPNTRDGDEFQINSDKILVNRSTNDKPLTGVKFEINENDNEIVGTFKIVDKK